MDDKTTQKDTIDSSIFTPPTLTSETRGNSNSVNMSSLLESVGMSYDTYSKSKDEE